MSTADPPKIPPYNFIYRELVKSPDDIVGIVAYGRYKQQKIEWLSKFKADHGKEPDEGDFDHFHRSTNTVTALDGYRLQAKEILDNFFSRSLEQATLEIEESYNETLKNQLSDVEARYAAACRPVLDEIKETAKSEIRSMKPKFWVGVWQETLANIVFVVIAALVIVVLWSQQHSFFQLAGEAFGYEVKEKPAVTSTQK